MLKIVITAIIVAILTVFAVIKVQENNSQKELGYKMQVNQKNLNKSAQITENGSAKIEEGAAKEVSEIVTPTINKSKTLDLSRQNLTKAPSYIFDRTQIEELNLSNNLLEGSLQAEVRHLQNLRVLNLSNNEFTGLPAEVGQLKNLEVLDLSNNDLTGLPNELGNLSKLKFLNLKGNNYSVHDLNIIRESLPSSVDVLTD